MAPYCAWSFSHLSGEEYDLGAEAWQFTLPGGKVDDSSPEGILSQAEMELRQETGYVAHKVHLFVGYELEWDALEMEEGEDINVQTFALDEALEATKRDCRCEPEVALGLWLYGGVTASGYLTDIL